MRYFIIFSLLAFCSNANGQNLELLNGKDFKQPGKLNPAFTGSQEDLIRIITDAEIGQSIQLMVEGRMPLKLGNYMIGVERTFTDDASNNMFNITYGRKSKGENKNIKWRYGGSLQFNQRSLSIPGYDSTAGYQYKDINGDIRSVARLDDLRTNFDFMDIELGASVSYKNLFAGVGLENLLNKNVSFELNNSRSIPIAANISMGGFLSIGEKLTVFPTMLFVANKVEYFGKASVDVATTRFNVSAAYIKSDQFEDINAAVALKIKKVFAGIKYTHPLNATSSDLLPSFNIFLNSTVFKSRDLFKSDFAKQMKKFY